ncbi:MAG TPA: hypothetical protein VGR01_15300 [Burkholderiales bacterium]|jgi:hypothetical protein|nr:hypothetical protein [Burkholderiales bacterium]
MLHTGDYLFDQLLIPFVLWIFIVAGIVGIALGVCLIAGSARTLRFLGTTNRWVSLRNGLKPMEEPHDIGKAVYGHRRWFGAAFAIGGAFALFMLLAKVQVAAVVSALGRNTAPVIVAWIVESLRWILVAGGALAVVIGIMLVFSADALRALEARVNRWYSPRQLGKGVDTMHLTLDKWVETFPRSAGWMLALGASIVLIASMIVWFGRQ